jgi:Copper type II ascorbate-dependent monooxygenase, C-terminal domain
MSHLRFEVIACAALALATGVLGCSSDGGSKSAASGAPSTASTSESGSDAASGVASPGYSVEAGTDLPAPSAGTGFQIETPDYDASDANAKNMIVQPNQEIFLCYYVTLPNTGEVDVGAFQSYMSPLSSHHFIVYQQTAGGGISSLLAGKPQPNGTIQSCGFAGGTWVYATSTPGAVVTSTMPEGVGLPFASGTQLVLNMHFINTGTTVLYPKVKLNILLATNVKYKAGVMVSFNRSIDVPAATANGPGMQTVSGTCTAPLGSKFFSMSTHTHKHATAAVVDFVSSGAAQEIVHTGADDVYPAPQQAGTGTDWEHPGVALWSGPDFLTVAQGDSFTYSCSYTNTASTPVTVGETAASNEMCMAIGYYYPAGTASCN